MLHDVVKKGSVDRSVTVRIIDSGDGTPETEVAYNTTGIDLWYRRELSAVVSITEATLAALTTAHTDGGFLTISHGYYRLDLPDAAFATGAQHVDFGGTVTGMVVIGGRVRLVDYDPENAVRMGMTALPNAAADAAGGLPISDAGGLDLDAKLANTNEVTVARMGALTDWINGGRLDLIIDDILLDTGTTLDGKLNTIDDFLDTEMPALTTAVDALPTNAELATALGTADDAVLAVIATAQADLDNIQTRLPAALVGGRMDSSVGANAAGVITTAAFAAGAIDAAALAVDAGQEIADRLIARRISGGADTGRTVKEALAVLRNKAGIAGGTLTVTDVDDTTTLWTAAVTTAAGDPISDIDPA